MKLVPIILPAIRLHLLTRPVSADNTAAKTYPLTLPPLNIGERLGQTNAKGLELTYNDSRLV